ncbi:unnamed protein product [Auanema sp. JU1783]|nr:unnamed protein product [Auanema sp. JU1783]
MSSMEVDVNEKNGVGEADANMEDSASESGDSDSSEEPEVVLMVNQRAKRANAGNKMSKLIESSHQEDDFYKSAYGGFNEEDNDAPFHSPAHSDGDEVDSDFDKPEVEDEPISDQETDDKRPKRKSAFKEPKRIDNELLEKNKKWVIARMGGPTVPANTVDPKTQQERLKEAQETEKANVESLKKYEQFELERKKKREKTQSMRSVPHPCISYKSSAESTTMTVPDLKVFKREQPKVQHICAVTGRPAKYLDPITGMPYSSSYAFKVIRDKYTRHLQTLKNNPEAKEYLAQFES